jgi:hypothetical protein
MTSWSESELDSDDPMVEDDDFEDDWDDEGPDELEFGEERSGDWGDDDSDEAAGW